MLTMNRPCLFSALALAMSIATPETGSMAFAQAYPSHTIQLPRDAGIWRCQINHIPPDLVVTS
jgi:hypothetical protein